MNNKPLALSTALGLTLSLIFGNSQAESLSQIYQLAVDNAPQIRAASAGLEASRHVLPQSQANLLPNVSVGASATANTNTHVDGYGSAFISLSHELYNPGNEIKIDNARSVIAQAEAEFTGVGQSLMMDVAVAYFNMLSAQDGVEFAEAEKRANARQLEQTKQRFDVGLIAITDVHESQAAFDISIAQAIAAANNLDNSREQLRELTGQYPDFLPKLDENIPLLRPDPADPSQWTAMALEHNPVLQAAEQRSAQARFNVNIQRSAEKPTADIVLKGTQTVDGPVTADGISAIASINYTLFDGDRTKTNVSQARALLTQSQEVVEQTRRASERQVRNAYRGVISNITRVQALRQAVISSQSAHHAAEAGYEVGTRTTVDVLVARSNLFAAQRDYAQARYNYVLNTLQLHQAAGTLKVSTLQNLDRWLR